MLSFAHDHLGKILKTTVYAWMGGKLINANQWVIFDNPKMKLLAWSCIHDTSFDFPSALQAAAALCVGVGSFCDPDDIPGFAHFLEHSEFGFFYLKKKRWIMVTMKCGWRWIVLLILFYYMRFVFFMTVHHNMHLPLNFDS